MLHRPEPVDVIALPPITPGEVAGVVGGGGVGEHAGDTPKGFAPIA
jgi:ABC-type methionine transport system permease subunit